MTGAWLVGDAINTSLIVAFDPQLQATLGDAGMLLSELKSGAAKKKMNDVESLSGLLIRATTDR